MEVNCKFARDGTVRISLSGALGKASFSDFEGFKTELSQSLSLAPEDFYLTARNGKLITSTEQLDWDNEVEVVAVPRLFGGKGGFGSMLRAIGAQIEKTTNRDACRDLSGRRLRDINEEQRLKRWFAKQKEREEEKAEAKKRKLEKLRQLTEGPPLPKIDDQEYNKIRAEMADSVFEAVDKGFEDGLKEAAANSSSAAATGTSSTSTATATATSSSSSSDNDSSNDSSSGKEKDPVAEVATSSSAKQKEEPKRKVFKKTMFDEDLDSCSSSEDESDETAPKKAKLGN